MSSPSIDNLLGGMEFRGHFIEAAGECQFDLKIVSYTAGTGDFSGEGEDFRGKFRVKGKIGDDGINFTKTYYIESPAGNHKEIQYRGERKILTLDNSPRLRFMGEYGDNKGHWSMLTKPPAKPG